MGVDSKSRPPYLYDADARYYLANLTHELLQGARAEGQG